MIDFVAKPVRKKFLVQAALRALSQTDAAGLRSIAAAGPAPTGSAGVFDRAAFEALAAEIDMAGAIETFKVFVADTRRRLASFAAIDLESSRKLVQIEAHSLKSTAATFGFQQLSELARLLEHDAPAIPADRFELMVPQLDTAFEKAIVQFDQAFSEAAQPPPGAGGVPAAAPPREPDSRAPAGIPAVC